jgi:arylsulfatase A-like enzyme
MRPSGRATLAAAASILATAAAFCISTSCRVPMFDPARPDVVLIVVDTLRADHLGAYGYGRPTSPRLDALARRGTLFESAWAAAPWTLPSIMSIMTGRYPSSHRVENDGLRLASDVPTLAEIMKTSGYSTGAFVSHIYVTEPFGFRRGFDSFEDFGLGRPDYRLEAGMEPTADRVTDAALAWIGNQGRKSVFLFVHYFDPHWPYAPPAAYRDLFPSAYRGPLDADHDSISRFQDPETRLPEDYRDFLLDRYDGEIRFVDDQVGRLLDGLQASKRGARTWVVLTADHGEEFKEHGSMGHGRSLYEEVVRVPLIVSRAVGPSGPGGSAAGPGASGARVSIPVSGVDLLPTIASIAGGVAVPAGAQGRSLAPFLAAGGASPPQADRTLVSETIRLNAFRKAVRQGPLKLIHFMDQNRAELYDLAADPAERRDVSGSRPGDRLRLIRALFAEVDLLSGGWNLRWSSDGRRRRFQGQIRTTGSFRTIVPFFPERGKYVVERGDTLNFTDADQASASGLSFTVTPHEAKVSFYLLIDGLAMIQRVFLGGERAVPREMPFQLSGETSAAAAFQIPPHAEGKDLGFYVWRNRRAGPDQQIILDDEIRQRLRSLGYVN